VSLAAALVSCLFVTAMGHRHAMGQSPAPEPKVAPAAGEPARAFFKTQDLFKVGDDPGYSIYTSLASW
jgi:hypothetical protein